MSKKRIILNYLYSSAYQIMLIVVPFITAPYLSRTLQEDAMGINSYVSAVVQIFSLLGLIGLNTYSIREVAYVRDDKKVLSKRFSELVILRIILFFLTAIVYLGFAWYKKEYFIYFLTYIFSILSTFVDISWFYQGQEEFKITVTRNFVVKILNVVCIFAFIKSPDDLVLFMFLSCIFSVLANLVLFKGVKERIGEYTFTGLDMKQHIVPSIKLFLPQVASLVYLQVGKVMIEALYENVAYVGFYDQAERIVKIPLALITALSNVMTPRVSNEFKNNNQQALRQYILTSFRFSLMLAIPLFFGIMAISPTMIPWFLDEGFAPVSTIMMTIAPIIIFISLSSVTGTQYLTSVNKTKVLTISCTISAILNVIVSFFLIPSLGAVGAAIATVLAEFTTFVIQMAYIRDVFRFRDLFNMSTKYWISGACMFVVCYFVGSYMGARVLSTIAQIGAGVVVYFVLLLVLKDSFAYDNMKKGFNMVLAKVKR